MNTENDKKILLIADNQEHLLTGTPLRSMSPITGKWVTSVALRSPLANVGSRHLLGEILEFGRREGAGLVIHLGDTSDISCPNELASVFDHPFDDMRKKDQEWIASNAGRYLSAHVHRSAQIIEHKNRSGRVRELNIGSTLDYPPQAFVAIFNDINKVPICGS